MALLRAKEPLIPVPVWFVQNKKPMHSHGFLSSAEEDLNSHRIKLPLEPESSASAIPPLPLDK